MNSSTLLFDEAPIAFSPTLAKLVGLHEAILLQQIHYWIQHKSKDPRRYEDYFIENRYWVKWNMCEMMERVPLGKSSDPYKRTVKTLREQGILLVAQHWKNRYINTNFYTIDYENLISFVKTESTQRIGGKATEPEADHHPNDEQKGHESIICSPANLRTERTSGIEDLKNPPPLLVTSDLPPEIQDAAANLTCNLPNGQDYIDLLAARLKRNKELPEEKRIQHPLAWLERVINNRQPPDFTPAYKIQLERKKSNAILSKVKNCELEPNPQNNIKRALKIIRETDYETRESWIKNYLDSPTFSRTREQIKKAVLEGKEPEAGNAKGSLIYFIKLAAGDAT